MKITSAQVAKFLGCSTGSVRRIQRSIFRKEKETQLKKTDPYALSHLSTGSYNCLLDLGVRNMHDIVLFRKTQLMETRNCGNKKLQEIETQMKKLNLSFKTENCKTCGRPL